MRCPRNRLIVAGLVILVAATASVSGAQPPDGLRPEVLETLLRMRVLAAVLDTQAIEGSYPGPTAGLVPVSSLGSQLLGHVRSRGGAVRDAWNHPLLYWSDGRDYLILSLGSDGAPQFEYDPLPPFAAIPKGWAGSDPTNDLLIVNGVVFRGPANQGELVRRAMSDLRSAGTGCESFAVDYNFYPGPVEPTDVVARVASDLEPIYIRTLPRIDPWGNPYRFWSDTLHYAILSYGPDGTPDYPYATWGLSEFEALHNGPTTRFGADLVFYTGAFVQWPAIGQGQ